TCVSAGPAFTVAKKATNPTTGATITSANPGDTIRYVITVTNTGNASGSTPVNDTYDSRLSTPTNVTPNTGVVDTTAHTVTWSTSGTIQPGSSAQFSFDVTIPLTFTGTPNPPGSSKCPGSFDIINLVTVNGSGAQTDTCVTANPAFVVAKKATNPTTGATITSANPGDTIR